MPNKVDYRTFSQRVKNKYPEYINMDDLELAQMWVEQNPQYGEFVMFDQQPVKKKDQVAPSLGAQGGLQYASTGDPIADKAQVQSALKGYSQKKDKSEEIGFWENIGNTIINGSAQMWNGLNQLLYTYSLARAGVQIELATEYGKFARPFKEDYKTKTREQMSLLEESATAFAGSIPVMTASILTGGFAGSGARVAGTLPAFISGFDQSGKEADELGITDPLDRLTFQTLGGTIEGASELIMPDASLIRPLRQRALKEIVRVGAKGFSKADAGRYVAEFSEKVAKEVGEEYAVELGNALRNASFAAAGYDKAAPEMKSARDYAVMTISAAFGAGTFASVGTGVDAAFAKSTAIKKAAENPEAAAQAVADLVDAGKITQEQADAFLAKVASVNKAISKMPDDVDPDVAVNTADLLNEKVGLEEMVKELEENKKRIDPSFHQGVDDRIAQITARINELTQQIAGFQAPTEQIAPEAPQMAPAEVSPEVGMEIPQPQESVLEGPKMPPLEDLEFDNIEFVEPVITPVETQLVGEKKSPLIKETFQGVTRPRKKPGEVRAPLMEQVTEGGVFKAKLRDSKTGTEFIVEDPELSLDLAIAAQVRESGKTEFPQPAFLETFSEVVDSDPELQTLFPNISETDQPLSLEQRTVSLDGKKVTRNVVQRMQPLYAALEQRMNNAEEIPMSEIESVVDQVIQLQQDIQNQKGTKTVRAANGVRQEFTPLNDEQKRIFNDFTDALVNKLLSYDFATTTTTGPTTQKTTTAGLIATPREGRPLSEARVPRERLEGAEVTIEGRGRGRIAIKPLPGLGERSVYGITFEETGAEAPETISPTARETGTTPEAVGVEPQTEQDVRQETNASQEGGNEGKAPTSLPQEGRQEGQQQELLTSAVAQEGETPPATAKKPRKTAQEKADEGKATLETLKETLRALKAKPGGGANIDLTFGVVPITKAVWNTALDTAILAIDAGQSIAQVIKDASDYISSKIDGDWGKAKFEQYMEERFGQIAPTQQQAKAPIESGDNVGLSRRLSGNALLNAQDLLDELSNNGADIDEDGNVTVYHRTNSEKKRQIEESGKMTGLENGLFFSTRETGQAEGYGNAIVKLKVPVEKLQIDDVFGNEAHVRIHTSRAGQKIDVLSYLKPSEPQQQAQPEAQVEATAKALEGLDISPKNSRDLYRVNRELFGLNQSEAMSATIAMDKMIDVMANRAGVSKTEMYGRINFKKATEGFAKDLSNRGKLLFQLIGENAELSQEIRDNLQVARNMETAGKDVKTIRMATGWEKGKDGKWRYEIPDGEISEKLQEYANNIQSYPNGIKLSEAIDGTDLFKMYPKLSDVNVEIFSNIDRERGKFVPGTNTLYLNSFDGVNKSVIIHEIQHIVQDIEGFATGGGIMTLVNIARGDFKVDKKTMSRLVGRGKQILNNLLKNKDALSSLDNQTIDFVKYALESDNLLSIIRATGMVSDTAEPYNKAYLELAGEVEARNVQSRMGMTPEQRRATTLQETEDVARDEQIVLFENNGLKMQVDAWHGSPYQFDKFSTEKIGTGEGAQAFGWGLYFTDLENIAKGYAKRLSGDLYSYDGKLISKDANDYLFLADDSLGDNFNENTIRNIAKVAINKIKKEYIPDLKEVAKTSPSEKQRSEIPNEVKKLEGVIKELENVISSKEIKLEKNKVLYRASINKGKNPDQYTWLEWDKPISPEVKEKILDFIEKDKKYGWDVAEGFVNTWKEAKRSIKYRLENNLYSDGQSIYEDIAETSGLSPKSASLFLLDAGIDGVKYPAESIARGATSDTARGFNYVVFDENAVSIEEVIKFQKDAVKARGAMMITLDGQATIYALTDPNVSTPLHELAHVFEHYLTDEERTTVQDWAKTKDWTIKTSEAFARGFEKYLSEGQAPTPALQRIFDNFKQWLNDIYRGIVGSDIDIELNKPMRDLYAKMFEFTGEDGPSNFEKWKGDNKLLVGPDIQDAKTGEPIVVRAYHGTTNEFYEFDSSVKGSVEGHLGKVNYFTSDYQDAAINYLSEGPDLTSRVEGRTKQIMSELEDNYDDYYESIPELSKKYGYTEEELQDDFVSFRSLARDLAKKELYGGTNKVLDVFIKLNNPVVLGKGSTWFQTLNISETDLDQAAKEIADENDISVEDAKQDYDFEIRDRAIENAGYENLAVDALSSALRSNGYRKVNASEILGNNLYESEIDLNRLEKELRQNDKAGLFENEEGELASSQVISDFLKNLGFDGIILTDVSNRFRGMGLGSSTSHIHVFDEFSNQIKLADGSNTTFGETRDIRFQLDEGKPRQQAQPEAKPEKTISEQRKEFRETAKKYFDGLKKMGIAFDPERNSKEDIAFLKALAKYIKLELDAGMVTFKGFIEKTANLVEDFKEASVVKAAKDVWAKEVVKAYPKLYAKYSAAKRKELEKEIKDIRKTMIRRIMDMTDPKIVNLKSQLKTEKRRLSKEAAAQLAAIRNAYDAKTMMAMEPEDLMELMRLTEGIYKEGRSEIKALNESLDEAAQIQGEEMLATIASKDKRLEKLDSKEAASKMLAKKAGVVVAVKGDDRVIMKEEKDMEALDGEGYTFLFLNTTSDKFVDRGFLDSVVSFFSGKLRTINENARDLRTALELIKSRSKESQDFINGLVAKMNKASVTKSRKSEEWSSILKRLRSDLFGPDIKFGYTNWMNAIAKVNGKPLKLINGRGVSIGPINNGKIVSLYRQIMDPTNLVKTDGVRKIDLSDESIQSIIDYMNLPGNLPGKEFALSLTNFFIRVAKDTKVVLENNGYNSTKLDEKRYNKEDFEGDDFISKVMDQLAETRSEGFIPYTPIQATESPDTIQGVEINEDDLLDSGDLQKNFSVISNNMITRRPGGVIIPTDIRQTLNAYTAGMANMNAKLPILRETQSVFSKRNLTAMNNAFAPQFTENLKANYISFMTDRVTPVSSSKTTAAIKTWLMTSTAIPMFLNFKSAVLQVLASPNFLVSYDSSRYIDASKKVFGDWALFKRIFFEIIDLPTVRQRFGGRFSPDSRIISEEVGRYGKVAIKIPFTNISISAKELLSKGYIFSSIGDVISIAIGAAPIYYDISETNKKKYIADGMSVSEAEEKATQDAEERLFEIIQETQQSSEAMYLSEFQKQSITRIFSSFATSTMQYYRKARRAAARMKNKEGDQLQNAYEILHYTAVNAAMFQFFSSMFVDWLSGPGEDELEEMSREERMDFVRYMEDVMATVAQGTGGMGVALQALILAYKESEKSGKPEKIVESALRTVPAVRMKYDAAVNTIREWKRGDYVRSLTKGAELANIPADRIRSLGLQVSDALTENLDAQERIARLIGFRTESWMREKKEGEIWNGVQSTIDKSTPAERQRAISNTKSAYRDLFQLYGKRYAEATTEAEKARVDSIASKELLNVYNHRQGGPEFTKELQKLFNQSLEFNSLPKDMQKLKNMESNRKIGDIVEQILLLDKKSKQKAIEYWSSLVNNGIISKNEIERIREEYNTRKGLQ